MLGVGEIGEVWWWMGEWVVVMGGGGGWFWVVLVVTPFSTMKAKRALPCE